MTDAQQQNKALVHEMLRAFDHADDDWLRQHRALAPIIPHLAAMKSAFPDLRTTVEEQIAEGTTVATRATVRGTHSGPFMGAPPTGIAIETSLLLFNRIEDGEIVRHFGNADLLSIAGPLGLLPTADAAAA